MKKHFAILIRTISGVANITQPTHYLRAEAILHSVNVWTWDAIHKNLFPVLTPHPPPKKKYKFDHLIIHVISFSNTASLRTKPQLDPLPFFQILNPPLPQHKRSSSIVNVDTLQLCDQGNWRNCCWMTVYFQHRPDRVSHRMLILGLNLLQQR